MSPRPSRSAPATRLDQTSFRASLEFSDPLRFRTAAAGEVSASPTREELGMVAVIDVLAKCGGGVSAILWVIAAVLVIAGIVTLIRGGILAGIALIIVGLLLGPGGVSIFC